MAADTEQNRENVPHDSDSELETTPKKGRGAGGGRPRKEEKPSYLNVVNDL